MEYNTQKIKPNNDFIPIKDMIYLCLSKWKWFVVSLLVTLSVALSYIYLTEPTYVRNTSFLLRNTPKEQHVMEDKLGMSAFQLNATQNDEIMVLRSPLLMKEVVQKLNLDVEYRESGFLISKFLYGRNLPVIVCFLDSVSVDNTMMKIRIINDKEVELSDFINEQLELQDQPITTTFYTSTTTPIGEITVIPNPAYKRVTPYVGKITICRHSASAMANHLLSNLSVKLSDNKSGLIILSLVDVSSKRAEDVLNTMLASYDARWKKEQGEIAVNTSAFITERLKIIEKDLGDIEENIYTYKSKNLIPDVNTLSGMYMQQSQQVSDNLSALGTQQTIIRNMRYCLNGNMREYKMLPSSGLGNGALDGQIAAYNTLLLQYKQLVSNGELHPQVVETEKNLEALRAVIIESIDNLDVSIITQINELQKNKNKIQEQLASSPEQAKYLLSVERQQKVKESLYLFLLQRQEENALSTNSVLSNIRVISPVMGSKLPFSPFKSKSILLAIAIGLFFPIVIIFVMEITDTMVRNRKDLESLSLPIVGEVPLLSEKKHLFAKKDKNSLPIIVVVENTHNVINEAFRIVRTNLNFIWGKENNSKIIMATSFSSGSGKSFTSLNLAKSFAIQKKKVLLIDLDMRMATISKHVKSPSKGVSGYLNNTIDNLDDIIVRGKLHANLDILPVGVIPPNPAELLSDERLELLFGTLRKQYDYIFLDCPPLNVVADSYIIDKLVDMTLFVIRAGLMDKSMLPDVEKLYAGHQHGHIGVLLNGIPMHRHDGYGKYGYGYNSYYATDND